MNDRFRAPRRGFTLIELLIVLVLTSLVVGGLYSFLGKQRGQTKIQRLRADVESAAQIAFFIIGRDIRRAGSNPKGWNSGYYEYEAGQAISFESPTQDRLIIRADLNGNGNVEAGTDELITYEYLDDPDDADTQKDHIRRQAGNQLVIDNVRAFDLCYWMVGGYWDCAPPDPATIRKVRLRLVAGTGRVNPGTGKEDTKEITMIVRPRNFDL
jgi:prepilin-type N-terminal cleavage/methylation domain-containing protein